MAAVLGAMASAATLFVYGVADVAVVISRTVSSGNVSRSPSNEPMPYFIEIFDLFLLAP